MNDDNIKTMVTLIEEIATLREQKRIILAMLDADEYHNIEKDQIRLVYGGEKK